MERRDWIVPTGSPEKRRTARLAIAVATILAVLKAATYVFTGSVGVLASAADSLMDAFASGMNYLAIRYADEPEDAEHRYGHGKAEGMAGLFQSLVIGSSAIYLIYESVERLLSKKPIEQAEAGIAAMAVSMVVSFALARRMRRVARKDESLALEADSLHYLTDVLSNGGVLVALALYRFGGVAWVDPVVSLGICAFILYSVWHVFLDSWNNLMDRQLPDEEVERIEGILRAEVPGVSGFHDLRTRRSGARRFVSVHLEVDRGLSFVEAHRVAESAIRRIESSIANTRVTAHADPWPPDPDAYREPSGPRPGRSEGPESQTTPGS